MTLAWDPTRRRAWQAGFGRDHHAHGPDVECRPDCVPATIDAFDEDMMDAAHLHLTDASGTSLWHPRGLDDLDAVPARTMALWLAMKEGIAARGEPWSWWRIRGNPTSHLFATNPSGAPADAARCGQSPDPGADWLHEEASRCRVCQATVEREASPPAAFGTIGGVPVGASA